VVAECGPPQERERGLAACIIDLAGPMRSNFKNGGTPSDPYRSPSTKDTALK
jgi:hypothetical protein